MSDLKRNERLEQFTNVVRQCAMRAFYVAMRHADFDEVLRDHLYSDIRSPYYWLYVAFLKAVESCERHSGDARRVSVIFDHDDEHPMKALEFLFDQFHAMQFKGRLGYVGFADDRECLPLQSGDLLAWQVRYGLCNAGKPESTLHKDCLHSLSFPPFGQVLSKEFLITLRDGMLENARVKGLRLVERRVGKRIVYEVERDPTDISTVAPPPFA